MRSIFKNDTVMARHLDGDDDTDTDDDDDKLSEVSQDSSVPARRTTTTTTTAAAAVAGGAYNTGPKGVRADAEAYASSRALLAAQRRRMATDAILAGPRALTYTEEEEEEETLAHDTWIASRMKALSKSPSHGGVESVDLDRFLDLVESCADVCVYVSSDTQECRACLDVMAPLIRDTYRGMTLCRLSHVLADMDDVACPALLVYRDGELRMTVMRVIDELPSTEDLSRASVEALLLRLQVLQERHRM